jgi:hypothetical protein
LETRQVFGAKTSVCNFDILGETLKLLAVKDSQIPSHLVLRQVDDVLVVTPKDSSLTEVFATTYKDIADKLNVKMAPDCSLNIKAFTCQVRGKVLASCLTHLTSRGD